MVNWGEEGQVRHAESQSCIRQGGIGCNAVQGSIVYIIFKASGNGKPHTAAKVNDMGNAAAGSRMGGFKKLAFAIRHPNIHH